MSVFKRCFLGLLALGSISMAPEPSFAIPEEGSPWIVPGLTEPLVPTGQASAAENLALSASVNAFERRHDLADISSLTNFLSSHPHSVWSTALLTNIGLSYLHDGYFSRALDAWQRAWSDGDAADTPEARALVDRAIGELAELDASLGKTEDLTTLFAKLGDRKVSGAATEKLQIARETLALVNNDKAHLFNCGPLALRAMMLALNTKPDTLDFLQYYNPGPSGTTLAEVAGLAEKLKLDFHLIQRSPGEAVPVPSIVHWKVGHFAAIVGQQNGRYHIKDAVFPNADIWVTPQALDAEASGNFLVPSTVAVDHDWKMMTVADATMIRGRGQTVATRQGGAGDNLANGAGPKAPPPNVPQLAANGSSNNPNQSTWPNTSSNDNAAPGKCPTGMCVPGIKESSVSISLSDIPVGYAPPIGPSMTVGISYNQREDSQPANFDYFNIGQKWTLSWLSYVIDDPNNAGANVSRVLGSGGAFYYLGYDSVHHTFAAQDDDGSILSLATQTPISYRRQLRDGGVEIYQQSNGSTSYPRKIFLTQVIDPQGNAATLHYDSQQRLTSITDAVGRDTTFSYNVSGRPLLVSAITDPFGRSAKLAYDRTGRLSSITDIIGLTSSFTYDANSLIDTLTTPYGTTRFSYTAPGSAAPPRFAQITDPLGNKEREEWLEPAPIPDSDPSTTVPAGLPLVPTNGWLEYRNSFHWDKSAYVAAGCTDSGGCDYSKARLRHFVHMPNSNIKGTAIESEKYPLENRVWYIYPGQTSGSTNYGGTYSKPIGVGRVLDDGTSQVSTYGYDSNGNLTQATDPAGRTTYYAYTDGIDVASVTQADQFGTRAMPAQYIYNGRHRPIFHTDAAGRTTVYQYNTVGELASSTDALNEKTTYQYDANYNLASVTNANNATAASYTYDAANRVRTYTDSEGWAVTFDYDAADRITKITYPDGTAKTYTYNKLDLASYRDREGRLWQYQYDANRRLTAVIDPARNVTGLGYDPSGNLTSMTDPKHNTTAWAYDIEDRQTTKTYADNSVVTNTYENTTSRLKSVLDALGQTKQYSYMVDDNLAGINYLNPVNPTPNVAFTYDPYFSRISSMTDGVGATTYSFNPSFVDGGQQLAQECFTATGATSCSHTISYGYDALGRSASRQISGSGAESWSYDPIGRVTNHSSDLGAFQLSYLGQTQQLAVRQLLPLTSTLKTTWSYLDNAHDRRLAGIANTGLTSSQFTNFTYETTPENFITGITQTSDAAISEPTPADQAVLFNNLNEITSVSGQAYAYDANGNLLSDGQRTYSWDAEDRLVAIAYPSQSGKQTNFRYDGIGRRTEIDSTLAGGETILAKKYVWCNDILCQQRDAAYSISRDYLTEGELAPGIVNPELLYGTDQLGSVRRIFNTAGSSPARDYDPWGLETQQSNPNASDFGFAMMYDISGDEFALSENRAYLPINGRWASRDPLEEKTDPYGNLYSYVLNNPITHVDPSGLDLADDILEWLGPGSICQPSPNGAIQFMSSDRSRIIRFDITPQTSHGLAPHINIEPGRQHIFLKN